MDRSTCLRPEGGSDADYEPVLSCSSDSSQSDDDEAERVEFSKVYLKDLTPAEQTTVLTDFDAFPSMFHLAHPSVIGVVGRSMSGKTTWCTMYFTSAKCVAMFDHVYIVARKSQPAYQKFVEMYGPDRVSVHYVNSVQGLGATGGNLVPDDMDNQKNNLLLLDDMQEFARNKQILAAATQGCHHNNCTTVFLTQSFHVGNKQFRDQVMYWCLFWQPASVVDDVAKSICGKDKRYQTLFKEAYKRWVYERPEQPQFLLVDCSDQQRVLGEDFQLRPCGLLPESMPLPVAPTAKERKRLAKKAALSVLKRRKAPVNVKKALAGFVTTTTRCAR